MVLKWSIFKILSSDPTSIQDGHLQQTYCSFNIGPYGKIFLKSSPLKLVSQYSKHVIDGP